MIPWNCQRYPSSLKPLLIVAGMECVLGIHPRCPTPGYYQDALIIFACGGSGGDLRSNKVTVMLERNETSRLVIPAGTRSFEVIVQGIEMWADATLSLKRHGEAKQHLERSSNRMFTRMKIAGPTVLPITLLVVPLFRKHQSATFSIAYFYKPYMFGPQCQQGGVPIGCSPYNESYAREGALHMANWMRYKFENTVAAWNGLFHNRTSLSHDQWCHYLMKIHMQAGDHKERRPNCGALFKFLTHGGLEIGRLHFHSSDFAWWYKLPEIAEFAWKCCCLLKSRYSDLGTAWQAFEKIAVERKWVCPCTALWHTCRDLPFSPNRKEDYFRYLSGEGHQRARFMDIENCRPPPTTTTSTTSTTTTTSTTSSTSTTRSKTALTTTTSYITSTTMTVAISSTTTTSSTITTVSITTSMSIASVTLTSGYNPCIPATTTATSAQEDLWAKVPALVGAGAAATAAAATATGLIVGAVVASVPRDPQNSTTYRSSSRQPHTRIETTTLFTNTSVGFNMTTKPPSSPPVFPILCVVILAACCLLLVAGLCWLLTSMWNDRYQMIDTLSQRDSRTLGPSSWITRQNHQRFDTNLGEAVVEAAVETLYSVE